jgi:hypothetical protein
LAQEVTVTVTLEEAQLLEQSAPLRIKFAAIDDTGFLYGDANDDYPHFFAALPDGWSAASLGNITSRRGFTQLAWNLNQGELSLIAVEHETGIELILVGAAANILSDTAMGFIKWAWSRWQRLRNGSPTPKVPPSFVIEVPRVDSSAPPIRLVIPPPVSDEDLSRYLRVALASRESI